MAQKVISFHYTLTNQAGEILDSSKDNQPFSFIEDAGQIIPGLEKELSGLQKGDKRKISVPAADAYGERNDDLIVRVTKDKLPSQTIKVGDRFRGGQDPSSPIFTVTQMDEQEVTLDGNHPLAGLDLVFDIELLEIRDATSDELDHGHPHGEHGHSH